MLKASLLPVPALALLLRAAGLLLPVLSPVPVTASSPENAADSGVSLQAEVPALPDSTGAPTATAQTAATAGFEGESPAMPGLESTLQGRKVVLDWTVLESTPARFSILHPDGRIIATRDGRRSVQGWIASVRVAGWPRGSYLVTAEAGASKSAKKFILR